MNYSIDLTARYPISFDVGSLKRFEPHRIFMTSLPTTTPLSKAGVNYTYGDNNHDHAVTVMGSDSYSYDANGNQVTRNVSGNAYTLGYDAENRLVSVTGAATLTASLANRARDVPFGACTATFVYDGDGNRQ
jgi:YD repeat-containing protein